MLKYIKNVAETIDGVSIYPVISLLLFFVFFIVLLYYVKKMDRKKADELSRMPLDTDAENRETISYNHLKQA